MIIPPFYRCDVCSVVYNARFQLSKCPHVMDNPYDEGNELAEEEIELPVVGDFPAGFREHFGIASSEVEKTDMPQVSGRCDIPGEDVPTVVTQAELAAWVDREMTRLYTGFMEGAIDEWLRAEIGVGGASDQPTSEPAKMGAMVGTVPRNDDKETDAMTTTNPHETPVPSLGSAIAQIAFGNHVRRSVSAVHSIDVIVGGQYGSEAKGHVTQQVIKRKIRNDAGKTSPVLNIRVAGPNAGHTTYAEVESLEILGKYESRAFAFRQLPVGIVEHPDQVFCGIAAGSEIDLPVLLGEIAEVKAAGLWPKQRLLIVDPEASLIDDCDTWEESNLRLVDRIGSTGKGVGGVRARRVMRDESVRLADNPDAIKALSEAGAIVRSLDLLYSVPDGGFQVKYQVVIEGTQGYGLGLHAGAYPQCTSSDCRAIDFLAMAGLSPWAVPGDRVKTWVVVRPYPIRVAGNSGPLYGETTWHELGLPEEKTTVTKKVRRVGTWDSSLAEHAVRANGGGYPHTAQTVVLALTMADQIDDTVTGVTDPAVLYRNPNLMQFVEMIQTQTGAVVDLITTSPSDAAWLI